MTTGGDDAAYGCSDGQSGFLFLGTFEVHGFGGHVGVLETGARVEEDDLVGGLQIT